LNVSSHDEGNPKYELVQASVSPLSRQSNVAVRNTVKTSVGLCRLLYPFVVHGHTIGFICIFPFSVVTDMSVKYGKWNAL